MIVAFFFAAKPCWVKLLVNVYGEVVKKKGKLRTGTKSEPGTKRVRSQEDATTKQPKQPYGALQQKGENVLER